MFLTAIDVQNGVAGIKKCEEVLAWKYPTTLAPLAPLRDTYAVEQRRMVARGGRTCRLHTSLDTRLLAEGQNHWTLHWRSKRV